MQPDRVWVVETASEFVVRWPSDASRRHEQVGGKTVGLSKLAAAGAPVPEGFCLTTEAYRTFVAANGLQSLVNAAIAAAPGEATRLAVASLSKAFQAAAIPAALARELDAAYAELKLARAKVAVRSSATAEDLEDASFAGEQATVLGVQGRAALHDAVRHCWASMWSDRAIAYRRRLQVESHDVALAVIVQQMVEAQCAGVVFTRNPVTHRDDTLVIEAVWGLGESLVSGTATPEHVEMDRKSMRVRNRGRRNQDMQMVCGADGMGAEPLPAARRKRACLDRRQEKELARISLELEARFGMPLDLEWAYDAAGNLQILQARPITTLPPCRARDGGALRWDGPVPGAVWVRRSGGIVESLAAPPSPLYRTSQLPEICRLLDLQFPEMGGPAPKPAHAIINGYFYSRSDYPLRPSLMLLPLRYWKAARRNARWWREIALPEQERRYATLAAFDPARADNAGLIEQLERTFEFNARAWDTAVRASRTYVFTEPLFRALFRRFVQPITGGDAIVFLRGFDSRTLAGDRLLDQLARAAVESPAVRRSLETHSDEAALRSLAATPATMGWLHTLREYCRDYGHVATTHDFMEPSAADSPAKALHAVRVRMQLPATDAAQRHAAMREQRQAATQAALARLSGHGVRRRAFAWMLAWAQEGAASREDIFFHALRGWPLARRAIMELGRRLATAGALADASDIFFLTWDELRDAAAAPQIVWTPTVTRRREEHDFYCSLTPPPAIPETPPRLRRWSGAIKRRLWGGARAGGSDELHGAAASPGCVTGPARIVDSASELGRLQPGDILVARTATPEWTPSFSVVAGLVTDVGGPLSHSSIIAREFGVPAVMGVHHATQSISEGQIITLDGSRGIIRLHAMG